MQAQTFQNQEQVDMMAEFLCGVLLNHFVHLYFHIFFFKKNDREKVSKKVIEKSDRKKVIQKSDPNK